MQLRADIPAESIDRERNVDCVHVCKYVCVVCESVYIKALSLCKCM